MWYQIMSRCISDAISLFLFRFRYVNVDFLFTCIVSTHLRLEITIMASTAYKLQASTPITHEKSLDAGNESINRLDQS